jgi:hypothetical protein
MTPNQAKKLLRQTCLRLGVTPPLVVSSSFKTSFALPRFIHFYDHGVTPTVVYHEIGHLFFSKFFGSIVDKTAFRELFGNRNEIYAVKRWKYEQRRSPEMISLYCSIHPDEDWAETFVFALRDVFGRKTTRRANPVLAKKLRFARRCIRLAAQ